MKNLIMTFAAAVGLSLGSFAQSATAESKAFHSSQIVAPYDIEVTYNKTVHVLFPAARKPVQCLRPIRTACKGRTDGSFER